MSPKRNPVAKQSGSGVSPLKEDNRKLREAGSVLSQASRTAPITEGAKKRDQLNERWQRVKLGQVAGVIMGQAPPGDETNFDQRGTVFVKAGEFGPVWPIVREWTTRPLKHAKAGDVLICVVGATCGKLNLSIDCAIGRSVAALRPSEQILDRFLHFQLMPKVLTLRAGSTGSAQGVLSRDVLESIDLVLPPIPEQRRIVAEIEKQFTRLEAGVAALRRVQANLKRYRAAVLKAACEGRLVPTEAELQSRSGVSPLGPGKKRQDAASTFETGEALLARILAERRKNWQGRGKYKEPKATDITNLPPLPEGWIWASVEQLGQTTTGFTPPKNDQSLFGGSIPLFKPSDLDTGYYVREFRDSLTGTGAEHGRVLPALSILVTCIGATIGKTGLARVRCTTNQQINALTLPTDLVSPYFVFWIFSSPFGQRQIIDKASSTTLPILNKSRFDALAIPLPPFSEQTRIVAEVERRLSVVEELEAVVSANLQRASRLRQSILEKAFTGKQLASGIQNGMGEFIAKNHFRSGKC